MHHHYQKKKTDKADRTTVAKAKETRKGAGAKTQVQDPKAEAAEQPEGAVIADTSEAIVEGDAEVPDAVQVVTVPKRVRRRESMMDRMRKMFMRKQPVMVTDIAV